MQENNYLCRIFRHKEQKHKMINLQDVIQVRAFARQDGAILGLIWTASFAATMLAFNTNSSLLSLMANLMAISTPFVVGLRLRSFRNYALDGSISFRRGLYYCLSTFFNATILLTIVQYLWFKFMDTSSFMAQLQNTYPLIKEAYQLSADQAKTVLDAIIMMKPIAWASMFMTTEIIVAIILSPIIAAIMKRNAFGQSNLSNQTQQKQT